MAKDPTSSPPLNADDVTDIAVWGVIGILRQGIKILEMIRETRARRAKLSTPPDNGEKAA
jgi:hypothetical protein